MEPILSHSRGAQEIHLFILLGHLSERRTAGQPLGIEAHRQTECIRAQGRIDEIVTRSMLSDVLRMRVHILGSGRFYWPFVRELYETVHHVRPEIHSQSKLQIGYDKNGSNGDNGRWQTEIEEIGHNNGNEETSNPDRIVIDTSSSNDCRSNVSRSYVGNATGNGAR